MLKKDIFSRQILITLISCFVDPRSPAEQGEDTGQQPNPGRAKPCPAAQTGAQEGAAHQALQQSAGGL